MPELDALILAVDPLANVRIAGLTAKERAVRSAQRVGATRVTVVETAADLARWRGDHRPLLVIRADQLVHPPLVAPLVDALTALRGRGVVAAVVPEDPVVQDLTPGSFAGALIAVDDASARAIVAALSSGSSGGFGAVAGGLPEDAAKIPHGRVARAPIATPAERRAAHRVLYQILVKPQDNAITRYLYRPVSFPLTRLLVWTPITPNQISYVVALLVAIGCYVTASASHAMALVGTAIVLVASYVDCCDGEVARVKLRSSRFGAWIDTIVDELSSVGYTIALGWHCDLAFGPKYFGDLRFDPWQVATVIATIAILWSVYCIYYNLIVAVGSANSQDYVGRFEIAPGRDATKVRLVPAAPRAIPTRHERPRWLQWLATYAPYIVRRDFIAWGTVVLAALHWTQVAFLGLALGGVVTAVIVTIDHVRLRALRRSLVRRGLVLEAPR